MSAAAVQLDAIHRLGKRSKMTLQHFCAVRERITRQPAAVADKGTDGFDLIFSFFFFYHCYFARPTQSGDETYSVYDDTRLMTAKYRVLLDASFNALRHLYTLYRVTEYSTKYTPRL